MDTLVFKYKFIKIIFGIECSDSFAKLTEKEKKYCYYFSKACWSGYRLCCFQKSYESPGLIILLQILFTQDMTKLKSLLFEHAEFTEDDWSKLITYSAAVFNNCGNFTSFGDTKFIPQIPKEKFLAALKNCSNYLNYKDVVESIWAKIEHEIYTETPPYLKIGLYESGKTSAYYSSNLLTSEIELANRFLESEKSLKFIVAPLNTRLVKHEDDTLEIKLACSSKSSAAPYSNMEIINIKSKMKYKI